jgi:sugar O-acyltransferase (sialic acid O-acetyltransferase NeuD family)
MDTPNQQQISGSGIPLLIAGCGSPDILKLLHSINSVGPEPVYDVLGCLDVLPENIEHGWHGLKVWDERSVDASDFPACAVANNTSGVPMRLRTKVTDGLRQKGFSRFDSLVHPGVDQYELTFGEGCSVLEGTNIGPHVSIGDFCALLLGCNVNHDVTLGEYCFVGPNATVLGRTTLEDGVYIGAGAVIFPEITIGAWTVVGAGSVVRKNLPPGVIVTGNPAKVIGKTDDVRR